MTELIAARLRRRVRTAGAEPLLTYYEVDTGARIELSAVTLLNWVDKTCHLLDELDVGAGDAVRLALAEDAPGHWVTAVWELACWQVGATVDLGAGEAQLLVSGPNWSVYTRTGPDVVACSLHPLGLPLPDDLPSSVLDYALEVRGQADTYPASAQPGTAPAWRDPDREVTQSDLLAEPWPPTGRRLVQPTSPWATAYDAVVRPLLSGGSTVVVAGQASPERLQQISRDERVDGWPPLPPPPPSPGSSRQNTVEL